MKKDMQKYFNGPFLKLNEVHYRHYQVNIVNSCKNKNSLVVLPTGLGKTIIGVLLIANSLKKYPNGRIIILAPTRPLVSQHRVSCEKFLNIDSEQIVSFTGKVPPEKRIHSFKNSRIIVSTPQVIKNDLLRGRYDLREVALIVFDEAHKTRRNYAYNFISKEYIDTCSDPLILGLTASPGKDYERIQQICDNLYIENVIFKSYEDKDVRDYIYDIDIYLNLVSLPVETLELCQVWQNLFENFLRFFIDRNLIKPYKKYYSKLDFLRIAHDLTLSLNYENTPESEEDFINELFFSDPKIIDIIKENEIDIPSVFSYCSSCISILHAKDLIETQDISLFKSFLDNIKSRARQDVLSAKRIVNSEHFQLVCSIMEQWGHSKLSHPKKKKLISILNEELEEFNNKKIIIFTQYREMARILKNRLQEEFQYQLRIEKFIGQATKLDDIGYSQKKQIEILQEFRNGKINILIATSVAEEGLDIPNVDAIIFYEPVPSEIRLIQRRGRTGRYAPGRCYVLVTEDTVDVPYFIVARRKERSMMSVLSNHKQLQLKNDLERKNIKFLSSNDTYSELKLVENFKERKEKEKEILANRSIDEILSQLDNFCKSDEYKAFKECGVTFYSDIIELDLLNLKNKVLKLKGKKKEQIKKQKMYLNKNVKSLINIIKIYGKKGKLDFTEFQDLARDEEIEEHKFHIHFNQACFLGYLKKQDNCVHFIMDYD